MSARQRYKPPASALSTANSDNSQQVLTDERCERMRNELGAVMGIKATSPQLKNLLKPDLFAMTHPTHAAKLPKEVKTPSKKDEEDASLLVKVGSRNLRQRTKEFTQRVMRRRALTDRLLLAHVVGPEPGVKVVDHLKTKIIGDEVITKAFPGDLGNSIVEAIVAAGLTFPVTLTDVYKHGCRSHCKKCEAMIMIDGTIFRGIYRRQRLTFDPEFEVRRMKKTKTTTAFCTNFCNNQQHPLRLAHVKKLKAKSKKTDRAVDDSTDRVCSWGYPQRLNQINRALLTDFQRMANELAPKQWPSRLPMDAFVPAAKTVLQWALPIEEVRRRFIEYCNDAAATHARRKSLRLYEATRARNPLDAMLSHLQGLWKTSEIGCEDWSIHISGTGIATYIRTIDGRTTKNAGGMFMWVGKSDCRAGSLVIAGGKTKWRLSLEKSADERLVFSNMHLSTSPAKRKRSDSTTPVNQTTSTPVKQTASTPVNKQTTSSPVNKQTVSTPVKQTASTPVKQTTCTPPVKKSRRSPLEPRKLIPKDSPPPESLKHVRCQPEIIYTRINVVGNIDVN